MASVSLRLPDDVSKRLEELSGCTGRSKTVPLEDVMKSYGVEG